MTMFWLALHSLYQPLKTPIKETVWHEKFLRGR
jgi:hypothetical protein